MADVINNRTPRQLLGIDTKRVVPVVEDGIVEKEWTFWTSRIGRAFRDRW